MRKPAIDVLRLLCTITLVALTILSARAAEKIVNFESRVEVQQDGSFIVTETIKVRAEGRKIRRGIYRDFPTVFEDASGRERSVGFKLLSTKRDGKPEKSRTESVRRALRIYLGNKDVFLKRGLYTYEIRYWTDRQLRRFDDRVEVYWNATGSFWEFPIDQASALVDLPKGAQATQVAAYTGRQGSTERNAQSSFFDNKNRVLFKTTEKLNRREGLTVAVSFDKKFVAAPTAADEARWLFKDYGAAIFTFGGALLAFLYYFFTWKRIGRDPPEGVMVPRWEMPEGVSPALVNFIDNRGLEGHGYEAISAALLNLAVKGLVELREIGGSLTVQALTKVRPKDLPAGEAALMRRILVAKGTLKIRASNGKNIKQLVNSFGSAMNGEHRSVYYKTNFVSLWPGILISIAAIILGIWFSAGSSLNLGALIPVLFFVGIFSTFAFDFSRRLRFGKFKDKIGLVFSAFVFLIVIGSSGTAIFDGLTDLLQGSSVIVGLAALLIVNILFYFLMGAPTPLGRERMDEIAGLKRYLTVAEKDRMNMQGAPEMSPAHYETLLPYAVALGVEKPWSQSFQTWLATAVAAGSAAAIAYHGPSWHSGRSGFDADTIGDQMSGIGSSIADSLTSSMPAPKSSSSGSSGGGFSGGGGGGGGGGGW